MLNSDIFGRACDCLVGGVDSPVRAWKSVGGEPLFFSRGEGPWIEDVEGNRYADYVCSWGPLILGHARPEVVEAVREAAGRSTSFGASCPDEVYLAEAVKEIFPSMDMVRFVSSGTEATMTAVRLARGFTGRKFVLKFTGCYHGHHDSMLVGAGSGPLTFGIPGSPGIPAEVASCTLLSPYNDLQRVKDLFGKYGDEIAAIIVEPWAGNMGLVPPVDGFLDGLRRITSVHGALLIFDEVITGFRVPQGGVQQMAGIFPDLTCIGKVIGGGLPVAALGGRKKIMEYLSPLGSVYQAGTLSGNPLAMAAGLATLTVLRHPGTYDVLEERGRQLQAGLLLAASKAGLPLAVSRLGSVLGMFFRTSVPRDLDDVKDSESDLYPPFFHGMLKRGHLFAPSAFESMFVSAAHSAEVIDSTLSAAGEVFAELATAARSD